MIHGRAGGLQVARHGATRRGARRGRWPGPRPSSKRPASQASKAPERASLGPPGVRADGDLDQAARGRARRSDHGLGQGDDPGERIPTDKSRYGEGLAYRDMADGALVIVIGALARRTRPAIRGLGLVS